MSYSNCLTVFSFCRNWSVGIIVMQSHGHIWWQSVQPMHRGRSMVQTWCTLSWRGPGTVLMQSTGQTTRHASQPVHMSSSSKARTLGSFFFAMESSDSKGRCGSLASEPGITYLYAAHMEFLRKLLDLFRHL